MTEEEKLRRLKHTASVVVEATSYQYSRVDYAKDAMAAVILISSIFFMDWIAFAMDVITTGM